MSRKVMKYRSLKDLVAAYKKGALTGAEPIQVGTDESFVSIQGIGRVYENDTNQLLMAALDILGIPYIRANSKD
jgi:hypothetical protein